MHKHLPVCQIIGKGSEESDDIEAEIISTGKSQPQHDG